MHRHGTVSGFSFFRVMWRPRRWVVVRWQDRGDGWGEPINIMSRHRTEFGALMWRHIAKQDYPPPDGQVYLVDRLEA